MKRINIAATAAGSLGFPSKMPGTAYGLPASACITGAKLAKVAGSVCANCYAMKGNYGFKSVQASQHVRLDSIEQHGWVGDMVRMLEAARDKGAPPFHRWHDSGDIQSVAHLDNICEVARLTPWLRHWLPTREIGIVTRYAKNREMPANLAIRVSATMIDGAATRAWPQTSTVHRDSEPVGHSCPARHQNNECGECRACWSADIANVSYPQH
mgnify:CR=1 FL=1